MTRVRLAGKGLVIGGVLLALAGAHGAAPERLAEDQLIVSPGVSPGVILAGELRPEALRAMTPGTVVIDLRVPEASLASPAPRDAASGVAKPGVTEEAEEAARLGIEYHNVPVAGAEFAEEQLDAVAAVLAAAGSRAVVLHCATGNRAAMIWGALALRDGAPLADVLATVSPLATRQPIRDALTKYADSIAAADSIGADDPIGADDSIGAEDGTSD